MQLTESAQQDSIGTIEQIREKIRTACFVYHSLVWKWPKEVRIELDKWLQLDACLAENGIDSGGQIYIVLGKDYPVQIPIKSTPKTDNVFWYQVVP